MISIITGTLNRGPLLQKLIENTVETNPNLELVLVDGGSTDGTIEYIKEENNSQIKLIEVGCRSSYPHFMNLAIKNAKYDIVCQWNDDVILANDWQEVIDSVEEEYDVYLFNWKYGSYESIEDPNWLSGLTFDDNGWCLLNNTKIDEKSIVMNYGLYKKKIFKRIGMYNNEYKYYYADADMAYRAYKFGYKVKDLRNIKVCSLFTDKVAMHYNDDEEVFKNNASLYEQNQLPSTIEFL
jgi:glycosyltransferase involved in cell wall biosynthesis